MNELPNINRLEGVYNHLESAESQGVSEEALAFGLEALQRHLAMNQALGGLALAQVESQSDLELAA